VIIRSSDVAILSESVIYLSSAECRPDLGALSSASKILMRVNGQMDKQSETEVVFTEYK
jgi:hypothetical protein